MTSTLPPNLDRELTGEQVDAVLDREFSMIVLADDDSNVLEVVSAFLLLTREGADSVLRLEGNMEQCFAAAGSARSGQLPLVLCRDGSQALSATRIMAQKQIQKGLMLFDHRMGLPQGLDIYKGINGNLHPTVTKALMTATPPAETEDCLKKGILDLALIKPLHLDQSRAAIAATFLKKTSSLR